MFLNLWASAIGIRGVAFPELADLAKRHEFGGIDFDAAWANGDVGRSRELGEELKGKGLQWGLFAMPGDFAAVDETKYDAMVARVKEIAPLAEAAGCTRTYNHVWPGHDKLPAAENRALHMKRLRPVVQILADHGVRYGLEFLGPFHLRDKAHVFLYRDEEMAELAEELGAGLVVDTFHWHCSGGTQESLTRAIRRVGVVNIHVNDARRGVPREAQLDHERALPGATGEIDAASFFAALREIEYDGPVIAEPFQPEVGRLEKQPAEETAAEVAAALRSVVPVA